MAEASSADRCTSVSQSRSTRDWYTRASNSGKTRGTDGGLPFLSPAAAAGHVYRKSRQWFASCPTSLQEEPRALIPQGGLLVRQKCRTKVTRCYCTVGRIP